MIKLDYAYPQFSELFKYLSKALELQVDREKGVLGNTMGAGFIRKLYHSEDIQIMEYNYSPNQDFILHRKKNRSNFYIMGLERLTIPGSEILQSIFFGTTQSEWYLLNKAGYHHSSLHILFSKEYLERTLRKEKGGEFILKSLIYPNIMYRNEKPNAQYFKIADEVSNYEAADGFSDLFLLNRVHYLIEYFFTRYYRNYSDSYFRTSATSDEMQRIQSAERLMLKDYAETPPSIESLSRHSDMSPTKFKLLFKEIFGLPVYQYYQKNRMQKAKAMLLSRKYSIRQVATELGFTHVKDFAKAFQKQFDQQPDEVLSIN